MLYKDKVTLAYHDNLGIDEGKKNAWQEVLRPSIPLLQLIDFTQCTDADIALVWNPPLGKLASIPTLKAIISLGQGVDHLLLDDTLPPVPIIRLVDPDMSNAMSRWVILVLLDYLCQGAFYRKMQAQKQFVQLTHRSADTKKIGIYGVGAIGSVVAAHIKKLGFDVYGWSKNKKDTTNFVSLAGQNSFAKMLQTVDIHINLLPLTSQTNGIFNEPIFSQMKQGSYFINAGRGKSVIEQDLLNAIEQNHLDGAALDVFAEEPLPPEHPFWSHPKISVWPHVAAQTNIYTASEQVAKAIADIMQNKPPKNTINRAQEY